MKSNFSKYFLIIMSFVFLGYLINAYIEKRDTGQKVISEGEDAKRCTQNNFKVIDIQWPNEGQDTVGIINSITIKNNGDYDCKDMKGIIQSLSHEGTVLNKSEFVISEKIRSKETKTYKNIPLKQPTSADVQESSVTIVGATALSEKAE